MSLADTLADIFSIEYLEEKSWALLDTLRLGDFFDRHNIPPYLFTGAIIALIVILVFMILPPGPAGAICGDYACNGIETTFSCPADCAKKKPGRINVTIDPGADSGVYGVAFYDNEGQMLYSGSAEPGGTIGYGYAYDTEVPKNIVVVDPYNNSWTIDNTNRSPDNGTPGDDGTDDGDGADTYVFPPDFAEDVPWIPTGYEDCLEGYLNTSDSFEDAYLKYIMDIVRNLTADGGPPPGVNTACADLNGDGYITPDDWVCMTEFMERNYKRVDECIDCVPEPAAEVCNDGVDNNCDCQSDIDTYDNSAQQYYTIDSTVVDVCLCNELTPCAMLKEITGLPRMYYNVMRCASLNSGSYDWRNYAQWGCENGRAGWTLDCEDKQFRCTQKRGVWYWNGNDNATYTALETIMLLAALVEEAKVSGIASDNITFTEGFEIPAESVLSYTSNVSSLEFDCSDDCHGLSVSSSSISVSSDVSKIVTATCQASGSHYDCMITIGAPPGANWLAGLLAALVEEAKISDSSVMAQVNSSESAASAEVMILTSNVNSLSFICADGCSGMHVTTDEISAQQDVATIFSAECVNSASDYGCEITINTTDEDPPLLNQLVSAINSAKVSSPATGSVRLNPGDYATAGSVIMQVDNLNSLEFSCGACSGVNVTSDTIIAQSLKTISLNANCIFSSGDYDCSVSVG